MYKALFLDLDDTIFSFDSCCRTAFRQTLEEAGLRFVPENYMRFRSIDQKLWSLQKKGLLKVPEVLYLRALQFTEETGCPIPAGEFQKTFAEHLAGACDPEPDTEEALSALCRNFRIYAASNGNLQTQIRRLQKAGLDRYFTGLCVSDDIGYEKPDPRFFAECLQRCAHPVNEVLMIGDSPESDLRGAAASHMDSCWYNPGNRPLPQGYTPKFIITGLLQLPDLLQKESIPDHENRSVRSPEDTHR